ncbi:MAG: NADH-quinone oxidoreductase subunit K [Oligoflexia bacterium]|nr:NADH-quinone oxidoreductase subunit K [Oligoflexia bacterium]
MLIVLAAMLGGLGLFSVISRRTLLGIFAGIQLMLIGASMTFVLAGVASGAPLHGHIVGLFIILGGVAQLVGGYALSTRLFYLRRQIGIQELRSLKR